MNNDNVKKKIKVSVITLHTSINYGSALQTYATKRVFEKLGCEVEFVNYIRSINTDEGLANRMLNKPLYRYANKFSFGLFNCVTFPLALKKARKRAKPIREFIKKYIPLSENTYYSIEDLRNNPPVADVYCTGSDQVWNSIWNEGIELPFFLDYAPAGKKKIAFAASIGRKNVGDEESQLFVKLLEKYSDISMREKSAVEFLSSIGVDSTWVLDPTLMLCRDEWMQLAKPKQDKTKKYLLMYVLNWNDQVEEFAKKIAKEKDLEILRICKSNIKTEGIKAIVVSDVEELISYFDEATCVVTDSFHATAFSINLHTKILAVPPPRFKTRIESLLSLVEMTSCYTESFDLDCYNFVVDWGKVDSIIDIEREKTISFLNHALFLKE